MSKCKKISSLHFQKYHSIINWYCPLLPGIGPHPNPSTGKGNSECIGSGMARYSRNDTRNCPPCNAESLRMANLQRRFLPASQRGTIRRVDSFLQVCGKLSESKRQSLKGRIPPEVLKLPFPALSGMKQELPVKPAFLRRLCFHPIQAVSGPGFRRKTGFKGGGKGKIR